jgi:hypothetical protein
MTGQAQTGMLADVLRPGVNREFNIGGQAQTWIGNALQKLRPAYRKVRGW